MFTTLNTSASTTISAFNTLPKKYLYYYYYYYYLLYKSVKVVTKIWKAEIQNANPGSVIYNVAHHTSMRWSFLWELRDISRVQTREDSSARQPDRNSWTKTQADGRLQTGSRNSQETDRKTQAAYIKTKHQTFRKARRRADRQIDRQQ